MINAYTHKMRSLLRSEERGWVLEIWELYLIKHLMKRFKSGDVECQILPEKDDPEKSVLRFYFDNSATPSLWQQNALNYISTDIRNDLLGRGLNTSTVNASYCDGGSALLDYAPNELPIGHFIDVRFPSAEIELAKAVQSGFGKSRHR